MPAPLVLLHGFTNTGCSWDGVAAALGERYRPLAPDLRGHGDAGQTRPVTLGAVIEDVAGLLDGPFALGGYSMGGRIALQLALALPGRIGSLALVGASPGLADSAERAARRAADERLADELERGTMAQFARRWAQTPVLADQPAEVRAAVAADRLRNQPAGLAAALRGLGTGVLPSLWDRLEELTVPVELIVGERDAKFRAVAERMAAALPDARVHIVAGAGHAAHWERPAAAAEIIAAHTSPAGPR